MKALIARSHMTYSLFWLINGITTTSNREIMLKNSSSPRSERRPDVQGQSLMPDLSTGHLLSEAKSIVAAIHYFFTAIVERRAASLYRTGNS